MVHTLALLEEIRKNIIAAKLPLHETAQHLVFGKGNSDATLVFIGEAPGEQEDKQGIPFVGSAGKELDKLLHSIGLTLDDVYIANILKYRPPNNRNPTVEEIRLHTPYLIEQINVIQPKVLCTLGNFSTKFILADCIVDAMKKIPGITQLHGKPVQKTLFGFSCVVIPLYHPAAILYNPRLRQDLQNDFFVIKHFLA